jgi:hypothetical protein
VCRSRMDLHLFLCVCLYVPGVGGCGRQDLQEVFSNNNLYFTDSF